MPFDSGLWWGPEQKRPQRRTLRSMYYLWLIATSGVAARLARAGRASALAHPLTRATAKILVPLPNADQRILTLLNSTPQSVVSQNTPLNRHFPFHNSAILHRLSSKSQKRPSHLPKAPAGAYSLGKISWKRSRSCRPCGKSRRRSANVWE